MKTATTERNLQLSALGFDYYRISTSGETGYRHAERNITVFRDPGPGSDEYNPPAPHDPNIPVIVDNGDRFGLYPNTAAAIAADFTTPHLIRDYQQIRAAELESTN